MDTYSFPPGGDDAGDQPTQQFWPGEAGPAGRGGPGSGDTGSGDTGSGPARPRGRRTAWRWTAGIAAAVVAAAGVTIAGLALTGSSPAGGTQAAALNAVLSSAGSAAPSSGPSAGAGAAAGHRCSGAGAAGSRGSSATQQSPAQPGTSSQASTTSTTSTTSQPGTSRPRRARAGRARVFACRHPLLVRAILRGLHGQVTFHTRRGGTKTLAFERGTVRSVASGHDIVVRASDGTTWTWHLVATTVVRQRGSKLSTSALSAGEVVWVGGQVTSGGRNARLILIRPASAPAAPATTPAG